MQKSVSSVDVFDAARFLFEKSGRQSPPSNQQVRDYLGRGSMTTISKYMRQWRDMFGIDGQEQTPEAHLDSVVRFVFEALEEKADAKIETAKDEFDEQKHKLDQQIQSLIKDKRHLESRLSDLDALLQEANEQIQQLRTLNESHENSITALSNEVHAKKARNTELAETLAVERDRLQRKEKEWSANQDELVRQSAQLAASLEQCREKIKAQAETIAKQEADLEHSRSENKELEKSLLNFTRDYKEISLHLRESDEERNRLQQQLDRATLKEAAAESALLQKSEELVRSLDGQAALIADKTRLEQDKDRLISELESLKKQIEKDNKEKTSKQGKQEH